MDGLASQVALHSGCTLLSLRVRAIARKMDVAEHRQLIYYRVGGCLQNSRESDPRTVIARELTLSRIHELPLTIESGPRPSEPRKRIGRVFSPVRTRPVLRQKTLEPMYYLFLVSARMEFSARTAARSLEILVEHTSLLLRFAPSHACADDRANRVSDGAHHD